MKLNAFLGIMLAFSTCSLAGMLPTNEDLAKDFASPPDSARPGVYWYFMDGNQTKEGMTRDLESMKQAGLGHALFLDINHGVPRGSVAFLGEEWQNQYVHAVREAERIGLEIYLGSGPGWAGSGGPWVKPEQSMQHLVAAKIDVEGPARFEQKLPVADPRRPYFGNVPNSSMAAWKTYYKDIAVLAFPTPSAEDKIPDIDEKALYYRAPFSSTPRTKPYLQSSSSYPATTNAISQSQILDLTSLMKPDGSLDWQIPAGKWTVMRFVSRNNGAITRPAPEAGLGFEADKMDADSFDAHYEFYIGKLLKKVGPRQKGAGWTMLHIDSWEMGAQNWTPKLREEFKARRGYDPQPFYPAYLGYIVESREITERFLWDLRRTGSELVVEKHAQHLKDLGRKAGMTLSIEPYDMNPAGDFDLGAVADVPMCEFWSHGFHTEFSAHEASSIAHIMGRPVVAAEAFTGAPGEDWKFYPGNLKNQGDWAFASGVNRFTYHTFAHKPNEDRPGMQMGPYGVHWDRGQTWWPMVDAYHRYIARSSYMLRQGHAVADVLYLMPEGAPNVFQPPSSALDGKGRMMDRRGYNFDGCSAAALIKLADVHNGNITFPGGASYRLLVLPNWPTMTPELAGKIQSLVKAGATVIGNPPVRSPSLEHYPVCDQELALTVKDLWDTFETPATQTNRACGKGHLIWGGGPSSNSNLYPDYESTAAILRSQKISPDFTSPGPIRYTHRSTPDREIYFVANRTDQAVQTSATFRAVATTPELWDAITGKIRPLPEFTSADGLTTIPLEFAPFESYFVVFPQDKAGVAVAGTNRKNFATLKTIATLPGPWTVSFDPAMGGPAQVQFEKLEDWSKRPEPGIKFYSGIATYRTTFELQSAPTELLLNLGDVQVMARVRLNGRDCGTAWTAPWNVDISGAAKTGKNELEIEVANLWPNRMIGDAAEGKQFSKSTYRPYKASQPLLPSGLLGPVTIRN